MLVVEGDDIAAGGERAQIGERSIVAHDHEPATRAAESSADSASTRNDWPSEIAA